jgi:hypothetical protein
MSNNDWYGKLNDVIGETNVDLLKEFMEKNKLVISVKNVK